MSFKKLIREMVKKDSPDKRIFSTETIDIQQSSGQIFTTSGNGINMSTNRLIKKGGSIVVVTDEKGKRHGIGENCK